MLNYPRYFLNTLTGKLSRKLESFQARRINKLDFQVTYGRLVKALLRAHDAERAMTLAVGGEFEAVGSLEFELLKHFGLREDFYVIDVGCGSGRLAKQLSGYSTGRYLGIDIIPELLDHARRIVERPDWRFERANGLSIPEEDNAADMVCFFSVFTHLLHEQTYVYLQEAKRVVKPGGIIVFSFLDFTVPDHWNVFVYNQLDLDVNAHPLNMFISKDAIRVWAEHLGLHVHTMEDADKAFIPLSKPIVFENGTVMEKAGAFGQSVCVLQKDSGAEAGEDRIS